MPLPILFVVLVCSIVFVLMDLLYQTNSRSTLIAMFVAFFVVMWLLLWGVAKDSKVCEAWCSVSESVRSDGIHVQLFKTPDKKTHNIADLLHGSCPHATAIRVRLYDQVVLGIWWPRSLKVKGFRIDAPVVHKHRPPVVVSPPAINRLPEPTPTQTAAAPTDIPVLQPKISPGKSSGPVPGRAKAEIPKQVYQCQRPVARRCLRVRRWRFRHHLCGSKHQFRFRLRSY